MAPGDLDFFAAFEGDLDAAAEPWFDVVDPLEVNHLLAIGSKEGRWIDACFKVVERLGDHGAVVAEMYLGVASFNLKEADFAELDEPAAVSVFDEDLLGFCKVLDAGFRALGRLGELGLDLLESLLETVFLEGLLEVVEGVVLEGFQGVLIVGSGEDDGRSLVELLEQLEAVFARHLNVEEEKVRFQFIDLLDSLVRVSRFPDHCNGINIIEQVLELLTSEARVFYYEGVQGNLRITNEEVFETTNGREQMRMIL